jgi:chromosome segregation ATPase
MEEKAQHFSQIVSAQKSKTEESTSRVMQFVRGIEIYEQQLKKSRKEVEQLAEELRALVAAAEDLAERLRVQEKETKELAEGWHTPS